MFQRTRNYAKDYQRVGKSIQYTGQHYRFNLEQPQLNRRKAAYLLLLTAAAAMFAAVGVTGSAAFGGAGKPAAFYVVLPYVALLLPLGLALARAMLLVLLKRPLEFAEYDKYLVLQKGALMAALVLAGCLILGNLAYIIFSGERAAGEIAVLLESLLLETCIFIAFVQYRALFSCVVIDETSRVLYDC